MCFDFPYNMCLKHSSFQEELGDILPKMYKGLHVKYPLFLSDFNEFEFSRQILEKKKQPKIKFHENPYSGNRGIP